MIARAVVLSLAIAVVGCGGADKPVPSSGKPSGKTYPLVGLVRKVDAEKGEVTLRHEEVPGFMAAMTMPFRVADKAALEDLQVGDKVTATLRVTADDFVLEKLEMTEAAPPPSLTLDLSKGSPQVRKTLPKLEPGQAVPDFSVTTQEGKTLKLSDLRGEVVVLTFVFTRCPRPDFCPRIDTKFAELSRMVAAVPSRVDRVRFLSVSFDPEHDTPEVLAKHAKLRGAKPPFWQFAVASHEELRKVAEPLGLVYGPREDEIIHNLATVILGADGRLVERLEGSSWSNDQAFATIRRALTQ